MPPLLRPAESILLILDPRPEHRERLNSSSQELTARKLSTAHRAAQAAGVPVHIARSGSSEPPDTWIGLSAPIAVANTHILPPTTAEWADTPLGLAITAADRKSLVLCGFWLECTITFTALASNAEGLDVSVLVDATPHWLADTKQLAIDRLVQAGVVPMTTAQMIMEWAEGETSDANKSELMSMLSDL